MLEELLSGLTRRQTMLLLATVTFGGQDAPTLLDQLSLEEAELLKHRAAKFAEIPREKRIPALAQEIRRLLSWRSSRIRSVDPKELARLIRRERHVTRGIIFRALPEVLAQAVREHLPPEEQGAAGVELAPGVMSVIRWKLEVILERAGTQEHWKFSDLLGLWPREIYTLVERQGVRALAQAFAGLPTPEREQAFSQLPPDVRLIAEKATSGAAARALREDDARTLLSHHGFDKSVHEAIRSAGAQRLVRAALAQSAAFAQKLLERQAGPLVPLAKKWMEDATTQAAARGDGGRSEIVLDLERMGVRGLVERPYRLVARARSEATSSRSVSVSPRPSSFKEGTASLRGSRPGKGHGTGGGSG